MKESIFTKVSLVNIFFKGQQKINKNAKSVLASLVKSLRPVWRAQETPEGGRAAHLHGEANVKRRALLPEATDASTRAAMHWREHCVEGAREPLS